MVSLTQNDVEHLLKTADFQLKNSKTQIQKYFGAGDINYTGIVAYRRLRALICWQMQDQTVYIADFQAFKKGYGKKLLLDFLQQYGSDHSVYLTAWTLFNERKLLKYYRDKQFNFSECTMNLYGKRTHVFFSGCMADNIKKIVRSHIK